MKRKDDGKTMVPMFPRLHVNDAEKAGPKAPPRNKMALYEQFSIPAQRFNSKSSSATLTQKNLQVSANERNPPLNVSPSTNTHQDDKFHARLSDVENVSTSFIQHEYMKKFGDEDDFMVPVFVHTGIGHDASRNRLVSLGSELSGRSIELKNGCDKLKPEAMKKSNHKRNHYRTYSAKITANLSGVEETRGLVEEEGEPRIQNFRDSPAGSCEKLSDSDTCLQKSCRNISYVDKSKWRNGVFESIKDKKENNVLEPRNDFRSREDNGDLKEIDIEIGHSDGRTKCASQLEYADKNDDVSETSMVASVSSFDITPDDVVGVIGQKQFWKARREIMNQQRVFAVQVFELHRLIKVQQLIARSPHLLLENGALLANSSIRVSPTKILTPENTAKTQTQYVHKSISNNTKQKGECSAVSAVGKTCLTSLSSVKNSTCGPYTENPKAGDWCLHQPPGHQWLIPVMTPSEGLVYKPYPGPGPGSIPYNPVMNPAFGVHCSPQLAPAYMTPYGMPLVNPSLLGSSVEQVSWYPRPGSNDQSGQASTGVSPFHLQTQSSCNMQAEKDGAARQGGKVGGCKESDLQLSTASSSPSEKGWGGGKDKISKGRDPLPLFPGTRVVEKPAQVIRVVPHNRRSASESAGRIFRSIQQERNQNDQL